MAPKMIACITQRLGDTSVMRLEEVDRPEPMPTEVLVRVHAAGVNPVDWKTRASGGMGGLLGDPPFILGWDVSGVVEELGPGTTRFQRGDEVYGMVRFPHAAGAYAEYVTSPSRHLARKPALIDHVHAAGVPLAALTAWQALFDTAKLAAGQRLLVHAAAGGVGHFAVQLAVAAGATVIGTASARNREFVLGLGASDVIDYTAGPFETQVAGVDVVFDLVGGEYAERSLEVIAPGGVLVCAPSPSAGLADRAQSRGVRATRLLVEPDHATLEELARRIDAGRLRVHVDQTFPLAGAGRAHEIGELGHTRGKLVLIVGDG